MYLKANGFQIKRLPIYGREMFFTDNWRNYTWIAVNIAINIFYLGKHFGLIKRFRPPKSTFPLMIIISCISTAGLLLKVRHHHIIFSIIIMRLISVLF